MKLKIYPQSILILFIQSSPKPKTFMHNKL